MRRKVGVSVVKAKQDDKEKFTKIGKNLENEKLSFVQDVLEKFKTNLTEFAQKHRDRINEDPEFRQQFHKMCIGVGVDPLASGKGFWADLLGFGDFYYELSVKIMQICLRTRAINGGIMKVQDLLHQLQQDRSLMSANQHHAKMVINQEDILRSLEKVAILGNGIRIVTLQSKEKLVVSIPTEINADHEFVLNYASQNDGLLPHRLLSKQYEWTEERINYVINPLLQEGVVWLDIQPGKSIILINFFCMV